VSHECRQGLVRHEIGRFVARGIDMAKLAQQDIEVLGCQVGQAQYRTAAVDGP
jgi:hypothetical protein